MLLLPFPSRVRNSPRRSLLLPMCSLLVRLHISELMRHNVYYRPFQCLQVGQHRIYMRDLCGHRIYRLFFRWIGAVRSRRRHLYRNRILAACHYCIRRIIHFPPHSPYGRLRNTAILLPDDRLSISSVYRRLLSRSHEVPAITSRIESVRIITPDVKWRINGLAL